MSNLFSFFFQDNNWNDSEKALLSVHLSVGVGYYHHLILKLQIEYDLDLVGIVDFAFIPTESISSYVSIYVRFYIFLCQDTTCFIINKSDVIYFYK